MKSKPSSKKRHLAKDGPTPIEKKWVRTITAWRASGLSARAFSEKRQINQSSLRHVNARPSSGVGRQRRAGWNSAGSLGAP